MGGIDSHLRLHEGRLSAGITERGGSARDDGEGEGGFQTHPPTMENVGGGWSRGTPLQEGGGWRWEWVGLTVKVDDKILA